VGFRLAPELAYEGLCPTIAHMTDTPLDPQDVVVRPPAASASAVSLPTAIVVSVTGVVEKLTAEGASDQDIIEAIRKESPDIADVVEASRPPQGWTFYQ
jgi:hypothetical protein